MAAADIIALSPNGEAVLVVEAKNKRGTSSDWAAKMRRNLMVHLQTPAPYFLVATPDRFYFWFGNGTDTQPKPPSVTMNAHDLLQTYVRHTNLPAENLSEASFELIIASWLQELVREPPNRERSGYPPQLFDSGLFHALHGASLLQRDK
jgi:hypothetical protein